ncbi:MAG: hypothetical protein GXO97_10060 [Nitrospirae bacterium]|nr:hypothetical protein [Nitrospirota bacterium]
MSPDEILLEKVVETLRKIKLEAILIGNVASVLQGVPVMTQDFDFFVRDTALNRKKIGNFANELELTIYKRDDALTDVVTAEGKDLIVDFVFKLAPDQKFESVRSRARKIKIGKRYCLVADLEDILKSKKFANRPKDRAVIELIENTLRIKKVLNK